MLTTKEILGEKIWKLNVKHYEELKKSIAKKNVTWVLGAGISVPARLPNWEKLLAKMWARLSQVKNRGRTKNTVFEQAKLEKMKKILDYSAYNKRMDNALEGEYKGIFEGVNMLESAEYMWNYIDMLLPDNESRELNGKLKIRILKALLRDALHIPFTEKELKEILSKEAIGHLAVLLKQQKSGTVITYNYDDLLEFCLDKIAEVPENNVRVICDCDAEKVGGARKINIHHPHGALMLTGNRFSKESEKVILTEHSYYGLEQKAYIWENSVQAKALMDTRCVFMGFSGDDYNFRRIIKNLENVGKERAPRHYIFFCLNDIFHKLYKKEADKRYQEYLNSLGSTILTDEESEKEMDRIRREILESEEFVYEGIQLINRIYAQYNYWTKHGITPIWTTFDELPKMIQGFHD